MLLIAIPLPCKFNEKKFKAYVFFDCICRFYQERDCLLIF